MYCHYCGHEIQTYERFCKHCGTPIETGSLPFPTQPDPTAATEEPDTQNPQDILSDDPPIWEAPLEPPRYGRPLNPAQLIISLLSLLNVIFLPIFEQSGGMFPGEMKSTFLEVIKRQHEIGTWPVALTLLIFLPSFVMTVLSMLKAQISAKLTGLFGLLLLVGALLKYVDEFSLGTLFSLESSSFSIGFWVAFLLVTVMLFIPIDKKRQLN